MTQASITARDGLFGLPADTAHERIVLASDAATGLKAIVAIYSIARGPAFGGCRYWTYPSEGDALLDAQRLSQGMALKNALADLPFGGGKAVILKHPGQTDRTAMFQAFGRMVASLDGAYITAEDVGTTTDDMLAVHSQTAYVSGMPRDGSFGGNPSPKTAYGVFVGIQAAVRKVLGRTSLDGVTVAVQGLGSVGWHLCRHLFQAGARLTVCDIDPEKVKKAQIEFWATGVGVSEITQVAADVFAPCAMGGTVTPAVAADCRFRIIAGGANNQLISLAEGDTLHRREVFYVPDYLINAGGIISCAREYLGDASEATVMNEVARIGERVSELVDRVQTAGEPPARIADTWAREKCRKP
jgi:leucine dehydrogenase